MKKINNRTIKGYQTKLFNITAEYLEAEKKNDTERMKDLKELMIVAFFHTLNYTNKEVALWGAPLTAFYHAIRILFKNVPEAQSTEFKMLTIPRRTYSCD